MKTHILILSALCGFVLAACQYLPDPIVIPPIPNPHLAAVATMPRSEVKVTTHTAFDGTQSFTVDEVQRVPHKARVRIATVDRNVDANWIARLWNLNRTAP